MDAQDYLPPQHGQHLVLTIDSNLQMIAEQELRDEVEHVKGSRGEFVAMDPDTGEILALANYPTFNPQTLSDSTPELRRNSAVVAPYEPGSTFKPFIVGPAFMWNVTTPWEVWPIPGADVVYALWPGHHGRGTLRRSVHVGRAGAFEQHPHVAVERADGQCPAASGDHRFRVRQANGDRFAAARMPGVVYNLNKWTHKSTESMAQGYEVMVTPLQLATGVFGLCQRGKAGDAAPAAGDGRSGRKGRFASAASGFRFVAAGDRSGDGGARCGRILCDVVIRGTAAGTRSKIWNIAGKTGTAHIAEAHGYSATRFNSSFMCCAPYENPRLVVVCVIHDPDRKIAHYGGKVAAPVAVKFIERALTYMEVPASPDLPLPPPQVAGVLFDYSENDYTDRNVGALKETDDNSTEAAANQ